MPSRRAGGAAIAAAGSPAPMAAPADAARDVDQQRAATRPGAGRAGSRRRIRAPASTSPPWAPRPGTRKGSPGAAARICASSARRRGTHDEAHVARASAAHSDRAPRRHGRRAASPSANGQVLKLRRARIRGAAEHVDEAVVALEQRCEGIAAEVWVGGDGVGAERVEERHCLARDGCADVSALGVGDERDVGRARRRERAREPRCRRCRRPRRRRGWP